LLAGDSGYLVLDYLIGVGAGLSGLALASAGVDGGRRKPLEQLAASGG